MDQIGAGGDIGQDADPRLYEYLMTDMISKASKTFTATISFYYQFT